MNYDYTYQSDGGGIFAGIFLAVWVVFWIAIYVVAVVGLWKMYAKAGKPGWAAIVPVCNWWVWVEMIGRPRWWFWVLVAELVLSFIPLLNLLAIPLGIVMWVLFLIGCLDMAKSFGRGSGTGIGLWLVPFVFMPILGFGDARYVGTATGMTSGYAAAPPAPGAYPAYSTPPAPPAPPASPVTPMTPGPGAPVTSPMTAAEAPSPAADVVPPAPPAPDVPPAPPSSTPPPPPPLV